jgi:uncharacterized phage infection (PIP) family protein YhgE
MSDNQELIWVEKEMAEKYKSVRDTATKREEQLKIFNEYIEKICDDARREFKAQLESLKEDEAVYTGLMLHVKQAFEKAKNEQLTASYELWEKFEEEIPSIREKTNKMVDTLKPLTAELKEINSEIGKINAYSANSFIETLSNLSRLSAENKGMIEFLVKNYKHKE